MKLITRNSDYAIRTLCLLARNSQFLSTREISQKTGVPLAYLRRIIGILVKKGIVESREGKEGGVKLKKKPSQIKLTDIVYIFQGKIQISRCLLRKKICPERKNCPLRKNIERIEKLLTKEFEKITIETLIKERGKNGRKNVLQTV